MSTEVSFTAKDVMALRQKTGLGMMECKKALAETNGDPSAAEELLRSRLKGKMAERTERATAEGRIGIAVEGSKAVIVEIRTETDFTAKNDDFKTMVEDVTKAALAEPAGAVTPNAKMTKRIDDARITTKENVNFARGERLEGGSFGSYLHHDGKRAALLQVEGRADDDLLTGICQHIVAHVPPPIAVDEAGIPKDAIDKVRAEAKVEAAESGKPAEIQDKIAEGKVRKYFEQNALLNQIYVKDPEGKASVKKMLPAGVTIKRFVRYTVGAD